MFGFTRKPAPIPPADKPAGLFSTHGRIINKKYYSSEEEILSANILRDSSSFKPTGIGMDGIIDLAGLKLNNSLGLAVPEEQVYWYANQRFIGYPMMAILSQNALIDKACTLPARDAARTGYELTIAKDIDIDPKALDDIRIQDKIFNIKQQCLDFERNNRIFGIRHALFKVKSSDPLYYEKPFNLDGVRPGSYEGIKQIDPFWITPELSETGVKDPTSLDFYDPLFWRVNGNKYHKSHFIKISMGTVPDTLKPTYYYGGVSIPQKIAERVYAAERTANEGPMLAMSKRLTVIYTDIAGALASGNIESVMEQFTAIRDNYGVKLVDFQSEKVEQHDSSLADLDAVIMTQYQLVAAIAGMPATKLLETSPKGFNATGAFEEASYNTLLETIQEHDYTPLVNRHHALIMRSVIAPKHGIKPFNVDINWLPIDSATGAELADINYKKSQTDKNYVDMGAIDGIVVRNRLRDDRESGYRGIPALEALGDEPLDGEPDDNNDTTA